LSELSLLNEPIIFPVHPRTRSIISANQQQFDSIPNIRFISPLGYLDFIQLEQSALRIITDSGGIQKEAYILKIPCITLRSETEWVETVQEGWNLLINPEQQGYHVDIRKFIPPFHQNDVFGINVAQRMVEIIDEIL
jgi:UDP-N-acetylglucosamine 2-epimerase